MICVSFQTLACKTEGCPAPGGSLTQPSDVRKLRAYSRADLQHGRDYGYVMADKVEVSSEAVGIVNQIVLLCVLLRDAPFLFSPSRNSQTRHAPCAMPAPSTKTPETPMLIQRTQKACWVQSPCEMELSSCWGSTAHCSPWRPTTLAAEAVLPQGRRSCRAASGRDWRWPS